MPSSTESSPVTSNERTVLCRFAHSPLSRATYHGTPPLIRPSRLTTVDRGGVGKDLSDGWCLNFAVGCTHGCPFCYMGSIHKRFGPSRFGEAVSGGWGSYILVPDNMADLLERTQWKRWKGREVMLSSSHDPYLPELVDATRTILERALDAGVRFCIQTRSTLVVKDKDLLERYRDQVRVQMSIATMSDELSSIIEPRVPPPAARIETMGELKSAGITIGVIVAPVFPSVPQRPDVGRDLAEIARALQSVGVDRVFGESLHRRGANIALTSAGLGLDLTLESDFDERVGDMFMDAMGRSGLRGEWWGARNGH